MKNIRVDGIGILLLGLAALIAITVAVVSGLTPNVITLGCDADCLIREDLGAQIDMAWASWTMVVVTAASVVIGGVTLVLIVATLRAAQSSAKAAEDTAASATETLAITRDNFAYEQRLSRLQTRSYVTIIEITGTASYNLVDLIMTLHNSGGTPAFFVRVEGAWTIHSPFDAHGQIKRPAIEVASGKGSTVPIQFPVASKTAAKGYTESTVCEGMLSGRVLYFDVFGRQRQFVFEYDLTIQLDSNTPIRASRRLVEKAAPPDFLNDYDEIPFRE